MSGGNTKLLGRWGESLVAEDLRRKGQRLLAAGYQCRFGEIDLITADEQYIIFTEVKLRRDDRFAPGRAFVDARKQARLRTTAELYRPVPHRTSAPLRCGRGLRAPGDGNGASAHPLF